MSEPDPRPTDEWACPQCGASNPSTFASCWRCGPRRPEPAPLPPSDRPSTLWLKALIGIDILLAAFLASDLVLDPGSFAPFPLLLTIAMGVVLVAMLVHDAPRETDEDAEADTRRPGAD